MLDGDVAEDRISRSSARQVHAHVDDRHLPRIQIAIAEDVMANLKVLYPGSFRPSGFAARLDLNRRPLNALEYVV